MTLTIVVAWFQDIKMEPEFKDFQFSKLFDSNYTSGPGKIVYCMFIMLFVHVLCFLLDIIIEFTEKKWEKKADTQLNAIFEKDNSQGEVIDKNLYTTKNLLVFKIIFYFMSIIYV